MTAAERQKAARLARAAAIPQRVVAKGLAYVGAGFPFGLPAGMTLP